MIQAENYYTSEGYVRFDSTGLPYEGNGIHIAGDSGDNTDNNDYSGIVEYTFQLYTDVRNASISMRYTDDVTGDSCEIYFDDKLIQTFTPEDSGTWDSYIWTNSFSIGKIKAGIHTLRVKGIDKKTYGFTIDCFKIDNVKAKTN
jgi:hypothetical protein